MKYKLERFYKLSLTATLATYFLIFIGGLVRVAGAGLGCPDWPKCFGRWFPPTNLSQVPAEFDPSTVNITLAWIEYINRLFGVLVGFLILAVAIYAVLNFRSQRKLLFPALAALVLVIFQGWYGSIVVATKLMSITITVHMAVALIIVSVQIWLTYRLFLYRKHGLDFQPQQRRSKVIDISFISLLLAQILVGTQVRTAGEKLQELYPLLSGTEIAGRLGNVNYLHIVLAISLVIFSGILIVRLRGESKLRISLGNSIFLLSITQVLAGFVLILLGIPALVQVFHLWIASILWGLTFVLFTDIKMG